MKSSISLPPRLYRRHLRFRQDSKIVSSVHDQLVARYYSRTSTETFTSSRSISHSFPHHHKRPRLPSPSPSATTQIRSFFPSLFPSDNNSNDKNNNDSRILRATRTLPFPPSPLFDTIAAVESYSSFLPFLAASTVTARDPETDYPTRAFLTVGYGPFSETFTSRVDCNREKWTVEARSGGGVGDDGLPVPGDDEGLFGFLGTRWELVPLKGENDGGETTTKVNLEIRSRFQSPLHTAMMSRVEDTIAGMMIQAFEKKIRDQMAK